MHDSQVTMTVVLWARETDKKTYTFVRGCSRRRHTAQTNRCDCSRATLPRSRQHGTPYNSSKSNSSSSLMSTRNLPTGCCLLSNSVRKTVKNWPHFLYLFLSLLFVVSRRQLSLSRRRALVSSVSTADVWCLFCWRHLSTDSAHLHLASVTRLQCRSWVKKQHQTNYT